ncbi:MAG: efflux RND transporter periplasmic adaptor subunit [Bacteroidota bacterium]
MAKEEARVAVQLAPVKLIEHAPGIKASGVLEPDDLVKLSFKTGGLIKAIYVSEGDKVKKGQPLAKLDLTEIEQRLKQSESAKQQASINIERATLALEKSKRDLESANALFRDSVIIEDDLNNTQTAYDLAEREFELANEALSMAKSNDKIANFNYEHSTIFAPHEGKILSRLAEPNEMTGPGMPVLIFSSSKERAILKAGLTESDVVNVAENNEAKVRFFAYPDFEFSGKVIEISPVINPESATFDVSIEVETEAKKLLPGFIGSVTILPESLNSLHAIPAQALIEANGKSGFVFSVDENDYARKIKVSILDIEGEDVIISGHPPDMDQVVTLGVEYLFTGTKVLVKTE